MIVGRVVTTGVSDLPPARWMVCLARPVLGVQGRGVAGVAARGRCAAPHESTSTSGLGGSRSARRAGAAAAQLAAPTSVGDTRHDPALAPPPGGQEVDLSQPNRTPSDRPRHRRADRTTGTREHQLVIPQDSRRAAQARSPSIRVDHPPHTQTFADPASPEPGLGHVLAAVSARTSRDTVGMRFLPCRLRNHPQARLRVLRSRGRHPLRPHPRHHNTSRRTMDHPRDRAGQSIAPLRFQRRSSGSSRPYRTGVRFLTWPSTTPNH
jgi:hypothetical protein